MPLSDQQLESIWSLSESAVRVPTHSSIVHKDECLFSLRSAYDDGGLFINLKTWLSFSKEYIARDLRGNIGVYLHIRLADKEVVEEATKLAIGVDGGFSGKTETEFVVKEIVVFAPHFDGPTGFAIDDPDLPEPIREAAVAVLNHKGARDQQQLASWENIDERPVSKYAANLPQENCNPVSTDPTEWICQQTGFADPSNLWLNLSDGFIGSGRRNFDGTGGTNGAVEHYKELLAQGKNYPLAVKLGTITADGTADVYSYASDEDCMVTDPLLAEHLKKFNIDISTLRKTAKTISEMELEMNKDFAFDKILESNEVLESVSGEGLVGLANMGNTCYMNSVIQLLAGVCEITKKFGKSDLINKIGEQIISSSATVGEKQIFEFAKLIRAIAFGVPRLVPLRFRTEFTRNHPEFASPRQQDAQEFLLHFMKELGRAEFALNLPATESDLFAFDVEDRLEVDKEYVAYTNRRETILALSVPNGKLGEDESSPSKKIPKNTVSFEQCIEYTTGASEIEGFRSPVTGEIAASALKSMKIATFPECLIIAVNRYYFDEQFNPTKMDTAVAMPELIDLSPWRATGRRDGEKELPDTIVEEEKFECNSEIMTQLLSVGFDESVSSRACKAVNNSSAEAAIQWVLNGGAEEMDTDNVSGDINPESITLLTSMGFTTQQATKALRETNHNVERAADWLFNHPDDDGVEMTNVRAAAPLPDGNGQYKLVGMVSHIGRNTAVGHYVCHLKKGEDWILFNDSHVARSVHPPIDYGYLYLYERVSK